MRMFTILAVLTTYVSVCRGQTGLTNTRLGLLATQLGVEPVPGAGVQGRPGNNNIGQNFPPNSGGGIFTQPGNFNPAGFNPSAGGINSITGGGGSFGNRGCFCHPRNQVCPPGAQSRSNPTGVRIAHVPGQDCPGQKICCSGGASPNAPIIQGPRPSGPIAQRRCGIRELRSQNSNPTEASFGEFPWMTVIVGLRNDYVGGGAFISSNWVLTAAHKVHNRTPQSLRIRVGDHNVATVQDHPQLRHLEVPVQQVIIHPQFNINNLHNDVALLRLSQPVNHQRSSHIGPVCLPEQGQLFSPQRCWVTGWGQNAFTGGQFQTVLKKVDVPIWDPFVCEQNLRQQPRLGSRFDLDKTSFLCAGGEPGKDACTGDGGAPLVCEGSDGRFAVVGLVAWGIGCAQSDIPGVYVNVANYVNFIRQNTGI